MKPTLPVCLTTTMLAGLAMSHPTTTTTLKMNDTDRNFMTTLAKAGLAEIQAGQVAAQQGNPAGRRFGRQMVKQHQAVGTQLQRLADNRNVTLPSSPAPEDAAAIHRLERMKDARFNPAYHHFAVISHRQAIGLFRDEIAHGRDPGVKSWAKKMFPMIKEHYQEARAMD